MKSVRERTLAAPEEESSPAGGKATTGGSFDVDANQEANLLYYRVSSKAFFHGIPCFFPNNF